MDDRAFPTGSGTVRYWVDASAGKDAPWLVFLPGLTADHTLFDAQMDHFSGRASCLVWDAPAHGMSRPYPLDFTMDDYARILHGILQAEGAEHPVLVGQSLGGYVAQAYLDLFPGQVAGFVSIDSAPLKRRYYPTWEVKALRHTKGMYQAIPWALLKPWGAWGAATTKRGRANMRSFMDSYGKREYVELAAHGYRMLADAIEAGRAYDIDCPALLLCGEHDHAGDVKPFNRKWAAGEGLPLVWVPGAGHNANVDNPAFVNEQIERFVEGLGRDARSGRII
ncbi:MAG: alpha/beta hydrolase [Atopobiaceae bacterium]|nr:alpha/beta hydrolase [Atopobiaceae bacterium]